SCGLHHRLSDPNRWRTDPLRLDRECFADARTEQLKPRNRLVGEHEADVLRAVRLAPTRHCSRANALFKQATGHGLPIDAEIGHAQEERPTPIRHAEGEPLELADD